ncbi:MAG: threonylcarbamoyl-AMP synthase [Flavobacteriales bacterium]|nr:threonylcarbamoyl-AMP synthase [Flavobacteriales bacterium]
MDNCVDILNNSGVILYPTDTIWGIGCNALDENAIQKIYSIKQRPISKSLIILVESEKRLQDLVDVPNLAWDIIDLSEKPVTIIYENPKKLPKSIIAEDNTIAIRLTKDVFCKKLISKLNAPLISTSANIHGAETAKNYSQISEEIKNQMDYIVPLRQNETSEQNASSIIKINHNGVVKIIRE